MRRLRRSHEQATDRGSRCSFDRGIDDVARIDCARSVRREYPLLPCRHDHLADILKKSVKPSGGPSNGGLDNNEWAAVVNRQGIVCAVAYSGNKVDDQWLVSRAIAAEKANTANAFSLRNMAMATANLYAGAQPGGFLFGPALGTRHRRG